MKEVGRIIYFYRKMKGLSQEELAGIVGISPAAVSKWERNLSIPDVEMLCKLADYFEITVDELLGKTTADTVEVKFDDRADADRFCVATQLMESCVTARNQGLLAVEEQLREKEGSTYNFLKFAAGFLMEGFQKQLLPTDAREFLLRYAESEKDVWTAKMTAEVLSLIFSGENEEMIREILRSFLGRKYAKVFGVQDQDQRWQLNREDKIRYYSELPINVPNTGILDILSSLEDENLRRMLRELSDDDFVYAAAGASFIVRKRLFCNLSDRLVWMLGERIVNFEGEVEEVKKAQRRVLRLLEYYVDDGKT